MKVDDESFLRDFYRALEEQPLEPDDPRYEPLYADPERVAGDPVEQLAATIEWRSTASVQLFSGFSGTGKSTELRRLRARLQRNPLYRVVLCDMQSYLNLTSSIDIGDFLLGVAGAFSEALRDDERLLGGDPTHEGYWTRAVNFLRRTKVEFDELGFQLGTDGASAEVKANLKADESFKALLQKHLRGHVGAFVADVHSYTEDCVKRLRAKQGQDTVLVLVLDSIEQVRGTTMNAKEVQDSVEKLFSQHREKLRLPYVHVVYTVPPWLKVRTPGLGACYDGFEQIPCVKVRNRDGTPYRSGLDGLERLIRARGDWQRLLGSREQLDQLALASGGYLRDLFRLLILCLHQARRRGLPLKQDSIELVQHEVRNGYFPIPNQDAVWLERVDRSGKAEIDAGSERLEISRFYESHVVMCYRNGGEWYGLHPLIRDEIRQQAAAYRSRKRVTAASG